MNLLYRIDPLIFFISFTIGLFMCYITNPKPNIVIKYPNPENAGKIIYKDNAEACYVYTSEEIKCPEDSTQILDNPIQQEFII
jgi:hypothetical protein